MVVVVQVVTACVGHAVMLAAASAVARRKLERHRCPPIAALPTYPLWQYERNLRRMDANPSRAESIRCGARQPGPARWAGGLQPMRQNDDGALPAGGGRHLAPRLLASPGGKVSRRPATSAHP